MILTRGAQIAGSRKGFEDFQREAEEFEARRQARLLQQQMGQTQLESAKFELDRAKTAQPDRFGGTGQFSTIANVAYRDALAQGLDPAAAEKLAIDKALQASPQMVSYKDPYSGATVVQPVSRGGIFGQPAPQQPQQMPDYGRTPDFVPPEFETRDLPQQNVPQTEYTDVMQGDQLAPIPQGYSAPSVNEAFAPMDANTAQQIQELFPTPDGAEIVTPFTPQPDFTPIPQPDASSEVRRIGIDPRAMTSPEVNIDAAKRIMQNQARYSDPDFALDQRKFQLERQKAQSEQAQIAKKEEAQKQQQSKYAKIVKDDLLRILQIRSQPGLPDTGTAAKITGLVGETDAGKIASLLDGIKPNIAFNRLTEMRQSSPTGGAVGQLTDDERKALGATLGSLDQYSDPALFDENVKRVYNQFMNTIHGTPEHIAAYGQQIGLPPEELEMLAFRFPLEMQNLDPRSFNGKPQTSVKPQGQRLRYNPATGRLE